MGFILVVFLSHSLSKEVQTAFSPATSTSSSIGPEFYSRSDIPETPPLGGVPEVFDAWTTSAVEEQHLYSSDISEVLTLCPQEILLKNEMMQTERAF